MAEVLKRQATRPILPKPGKGFVAFFVPGTPLPKGSKNFVGYRHGKPILVESSAGVMDWVDVIATVARLAGPRSRFKGPVGVLCRFTLKRAQRPSRPVLAAFPVGHGRGDGDKLERAAWDGLVKGGMIEDDAMVVEWGGTKGYCRTGEEPGVTITVWSVPL